MRMFLIFVVSLIISMGTSYALYKFFKVDVSPTIISLAMLILWMVLPDSVVDRINGKK
jgi:hypothetical protein